ncbi:MAG TPA: VWA domain-containing protein [Chthonomonadaceae bacterium]|nr:VWA domain-containing protein [Chthonomonadaceae bacterium]
MNTDPNFLPEGEEKPSGPDTPAPEAAAKKNEFFRMLREMWELIRAWLALIGQLMRPRKGRVRATSPWHLRIGRKGHSVSLNQSEVDHLLQRHRDLKDMQKLAAAAGQFRLPESDFFAEPQRVERLIRRFLEENPPWLHLGRVLSGGEAGAESHSQEVLWREQEIREMQEVTLFVPDESWRDLPLASMTLRPTRTLAEVWQARLLDQILPPELLLDRHTRGEILIPNRQNRKQRLEFKPETRRLEVTVRKPVPVPIETEGGNGRGGQLLYILLDFSASMRGKNAVLALAVISAVLRANMGQRDTRYLFRRYAQREEMWPLVVEPPVTARTVAEKDAILDTILATNFNGSATDVNDALKVALQDIEHLRREEQLDAGILLVTDGQAEILESTYLSLLRAKAKVHTVMVTTEKNPGLERISESFTALDIQTELPQKREGETAPPLTPELRPRRSFQI